MLVLLFYLSVHTVLLLLESKLSVPHPFRGNQNRELAQQWLGKLNDQWELQRFLQNCHEVRGQETDGVG